MSQQKFPLKRLANISFLSKISIFCYKMQFSLSFSRKAFWLETGFSKKDSFFSKKILFRELFGRLKCFVSVRAKWILPFILFSNPVNIVRHACLHYIQSLFRSDTTAIMDVNG
jgi:hypothetical protein